MDPFVRARLPAAVHFRRIPSRASKGPLRRNRHELAYRTRIAATLTVRARAKALTAVNLRWGGRIKPHMVRIGWMAAYRTTGAAIGAVVLLAFASASSDLAPGTKVVFLKGNEVVSANADGSDQRILTHDGVPKERPVWSPDGTKIVYVTVPSGERVYPPKALALIHVIAADGEPLKTIPVPAAMPDGTPIEGMRFVEDNGWYNDSAVFVSGSENPHYAEYRIFDVASAKPVEVYAGYGFATCASKGEVAYVADPDEANPEKLHLQVNGNDLIVVSAANDPSYFQWSRDCDRLAYIEEGDAANLVVVNENVVEARVPVGAGFGGALIVPAGKGFLLKEAGRTKYYDVVKKAFSTDLPLNAREESADGLVRDLGGASGNVWTPREK
jgi:hypothetical protein